MNEQVHARSGRTLPRIVRALCVNLALAIASGALVLFLAEGSLRLYRAWKGGSEDINLAPCNCSYLFQLRPNHPEVNSHGFRDDEVSIAKPEGTLRIMMLGDSVTYGLFVGPDKTFSNQLEKSLNNQGIKSEVINTGVLMYTPFNELKLYVDKAYKFNPDIVVSTFVMNDIANPRLHWFLVRDIPEEAIPNQEYDRTHAAPRRSTLDKLAFLGKYELGRPILRRLFMNIDQRGEGEWPTYVTGEDDLSIKTLLDYNSPEWQWLRSMYVAQGSAAAANGASFVIVVVPLAYQLEDGYPYLPQDLFRRFCQEEGFLCLDLLPAFRKHEGDSLFFGDQGEYLDIWHLTEEGHRVVAKEIEAFLSDHQLLETNSSAAEAPGIGGEPVSDTSSPPQRKQPL